MEFTFVTGRLAKVQWLEKVFGIKVEHSNIDLDEVQSLSLQEVAEKKLAAAYAILKRPCVIEDVALEYVGLGRLPGTFIRFFQDELGIDGMCRLADGLFTRRAIVKCVIGYTDGKITKFFDGEVMGEIPREPRGERGFGFDKFFMPDGHNGKTRAELPEAESEANYMELKRYGDLVAWLRGGKKCEKAKG